MRPGAIQYLFSNDLTVERLLATLAENRGWGQIVGPHGTGKSTLLQTLVPFLQSSGRSVEFFELHVHHRRLADFDTRKTAWGKQTQVIVDGYEQLSWWARWRLVRACRKCGAGLLVTTHQDRGLPTLLTTAGSLDIAQRIVAALMRETPMIIQQADVALAFQEQRANVRETLFTLYDVYEKRRNCAGKPIDISSC